MSRWGRGRSGSVAVPLDSALFRENSNCPSAARSAGTVGKWGITSFTSIRSAPYAYANNILKKPVQDQNSPLTVPAVETEQQPPKPKKFFKSRNAEPFPPVPQITYAPPVPAAPLSPEHPSNSKEKKINKRNRVYNRDSSSPELPRRNSEKAKSKKNTFATKASKKEETASDNSQPPNKRYLVRNRNKVINYAEDGSNSPIPDFTHQYEATPPKVPSPKTSPLVISPALTKPEVTSPSTSKECNEERKPPPIVLRISKGTSRIVSTDSNEGFTSPSSDRHSSMDVHSDFGPETKHQSMESLCSPKHEGLKITIKCSGLNQELRKEKKKDKKDHKSHKRHHKNSDDEPLKKSSSPLHGSDEEHKTPKCYHQNSDDEPLKKPTSPMPGSNDHKSYKHYDSNSDDEPLRKPKSPIPHSSVNESSKIHKRHHKNCSDEPLRKPSSPTPGSNNYDLYKTLASPEHKPEKELRNKKVHVDDLESQLAKLDATDKVTIPKRPTQPLPEPKPPERSSGRSRRNRPNINYSENDDYLDALTSKTLPTKHGHKTVGELRKESRRGKKKQDLVQEESTLAGTSPSSELEEHSNPEDENTDLIGVLAEPTDNGNIENDSLKMKILKKHKNKHLIKHLSPVNSSEVPNESDHEQVNAENDPIMHCEEKTIEIGEQTDNLTEGESNSQATVQSTDSAYNSYPNDTEDECQKSQVSEVFKSPRGLSKSPRGINDEDHNDGKPSVKLVITKKKGSIFKSKSLVTDNPSPLPARKRRYLYRHEWANDKGNETPRPEQPENQEPTNPVTQVPEELKRVTRYRDPDQIVNGPVSTETVKPYTSVRCAKEAKEYYTVVRNVKKAHQIQEIGEFQEFNDDVEYLLDALQDNNPISTRCLSAITLASKCTAPAFRMHLRAHGTVQKFFSALHDATNDQSLGLCTATVMFVLSQDRLNMDLDRESLELMLNLLESDVSHKNALDDCGLTSAQLAKTQERVRELCAEIKSQGKATHLDLENITVGHLAMETLLSLTSKRAGEWFKEELRVLGGIDHIVRTIQDCAARLQAPIDTWTTADIDVLRKADRCMRVLENVTQQNEANQAYLVGGVLGGARTVAALWRRSAGEARALAGSEHAHPYQARLRTALLDAALPAVKVLVNLSHCFDTASIGAQVVGEQAHVMEMSLLILSNQGNFIPDDKNFEFCVCVLMLLINLVQNNELNTQRLLDVRISTDNEDDNMPRSIAALDLIVDHFYKREDLARRAEENTDALLDGEKDSDDKNKKQSQDDIDETVAKLLARAGTHMEHTMVGAYIALLVGHVAVAGASHAAAVRARLPSYAPLLPTLRKYYTFLSLTASAEAAIVAHVKATHRIIQYMEERDKEDASEGPQEPAAPFTENTYSNYYHSSPSDVPQDMSLSKLNYSMNNYSTSSSDRMSSSMELDGYH